MKIRTSTKIALGFAVLAVGGYFGAKALNASLIMGQKFAPISPGRVNIVGLDPGAGYRIIVANQIAQLVETSGDFEGNDTADGGATSGAVRKRLPIREMLQTLQGNEVALGRFVMAVNDIRESDEWPAVRIVWTAEDLRKALDGDAVLTKKLVQDLNMDLDGKPLPSLRPSSLANGIIVDFPVPVNVGINGKATTLVGRVQQPYKPRLLKQVEKQYANKNVDMATIAGFYAQEAKAFMNEAKGRENVRQVLEDRLSAASARQLAEAPERILRKARVVVNESFLDSASYSKYSGNDGKPIFDLTVNLNDEGRRRLWQFSTQRVGTQLLLVADGIAIAAPRIMHPLAQGQITIKQMPDERLVKDAVAIMNDKSGKSSPAP